MNIRCVFHHAILLLFKRGQQHHWPHHVHTFSFKSSVAGLGAASVTFSGTRRVGSSEEGKAKVKGNKIDEINHMVSLLCNQEEKLTIVRLLAIIQIRITQDTKTYYSRHCAVPTTAMPLAHGDSVRCK